MHSVQVILAIATLSGYVSAQSSQWTVDQSCQAANIVEACIQSTQPQINKCTVNGNDYECLCQQYTNLATCYNNCPDDPTADSIQNTIISYCGAYSATASKSSTVAVSGTSTLSSATSTSTSTSTDGESPSSTTSSPSTASTTAGNNAGFAVTPARSYGALAGLLAVAGAFL